MTKLFWSTTALPPSVCRKFRCWESFPGTGGLTRVTDKRRVRRDHADIFCTTPDGVRGQRAKDWRLVDDVVKSQQFAEHVKQRALKLADQSDRPANVKGVVLTPLQSAIDDAGRH